MLILSPRAVERLETYTPPWPLAEALPLDPWRQIDRSHFRRRNHQHTAPSLICVGGLHRRLELGTIAWRPRRSHRARQRQFAGAQRLGGTDTVGGFSSPPTRRSVEHQRLSPDCRSGRRGAPHAGPGAPLPKSIENLLEKEKVAYDIGSYGRRRPGFAYLVGATIETAISKR